MAGSNRINNLHDAPVFEYNQLPWGDLIYGTKEQLQGIGIAAGMAFPGEPYGPKRSLRVTDPRGLKVRVEASNYKGGGIFSASISFPGRDRPEPGHITDFAPGVSKNEVLWGDVFTGTAESLSSAGLVRRDQLPGQPGMRKVIVTILADGSFPKGAPTANCREAREPGTIRITRKSKALYEVCLHVSDEEEQRRRDEHSRAEREWENLMKSLPRPAPLCCTNQERKEIEAAKALVASWPKSSVAFRERAAGRVDTLLQFVEAHCTDGMPSAWAGEQYGGYRFDDATIARVCALSDELLEIVKAGGVVLDIELRKKQTPACIAEEVPASDADYADSPFKYGGNVIPFRKPCHLGPKSL